MIGTKNILKITRHVMKRNNGAFDVDLTHPGREWFIGLLVSSLIFLGLGGYAGYLFYSQSQKLARPAAANSTLVEYKQQGARDALKQFGDRTEQFEELRKVRSEQTATLVSDEEAVVEDAQDTEEGDPESVEDLTAS